MPGGVWCSRGVLRLVRVAGGAYSIICEGSSEGGPTFQSPRPCRVLCNSNGRSGVKCGRHTRGWRRAGASLAAVGEQVVLQGGGGRHKEACVHLSSR